MSAVRKPAGRRKGPHAPWWLRRPATPQFIFRGWRGQDLAAAKIAVGYALFMSGVGGYVKTVDVRRGVHAFMGWQKGFSLHVMAGPPSTFPVVQRYHGRAAAPRYVVADWLDGLVAITAHELAHLVQWLSSSPLNEVEAEHAAVRAMRGFRTIRAEMGLGAPRKATAKALRAAYFARDQEAEERESEMLWKRYKAGPIAIRRRRMRRPGLRR